jgi:hypothetical protein
MPDSSISAIDLDALDANAQELLLSTIMRAKGRTDPLVIVSFALGECVLIMPNDWTEERQLAWVARHRPRLEVIAGRPWQSLERV